MKKLLTLFFLSCSLASTLQAQTSPCYTTTGVPFVWDSLTAPTQVNLNDDQFSQAINIGFPFCFFGTFHSQLLIGSNGVLSFNTTWAGGYNTWPINAALPSVMPADLENAIMFPWQDLLTSMGTIRYQTLGIAPYRKFVVQFQNLAYFSCVSLKFTGQVALFESFNNIETHIADKPLCITWNNGLAVHGIQNGTGTVAVIVPGRNGSQWTTLNEGVRFSPVCQCPNLAGENTITGKVYRDENFNCIYDGTDAGLASTYVRLDPGSIFYTTDAQGDFVMHTDPGNFTVTQIVPGYFVQLCPANDYQVSFPTSPLTYPNADFADSTRNCHDVSVGILSGPQRVCRDNSLFIQVCNPAGMPANNVILTVTLPSSTVLVSPLNFIANPSAGVYQYSLGTLLPNQCINFNLVDSLDCSVQLATVHCFNASVTANGFDCNTENNYDEDCRPAINSYDPNNKEVASQNFSQNGYVAIESISAADTLIYCIHFQNTGNDTAYNVVIMDVISPHLDLGSIQVIGASHPYTMTLNDHTVIFSFNSIMLPDSNTNEPASHGLIKFRIRQNPGNQPGTDIFNSAQIYFDINPPILTNQTHNYIPNPASVTSSERLPDFLVIPNPATSEIRLVLNMELKGILQMHNILGELLLSQAVNSSQVKIDIGEFPRGLYYIKVIDSENHSATKKFVKM